MSDEIHRNDSNDPARTAPPDDPIDRRNFLKNGALGAFFLGGFAAALEPLRHFDNDADLQAFIQQQYERLTPAKMEVILERLEKEIEQRYDVKANIEDPKPLPGVQYAYALNIGRCVGCRRCVHACVEENNQSRDPRIEYIRVLEMEKGTLDVEKSDHYYDHETVPAEGKYYMPVQCHQCQNPPCVKACPVRATWQEEDGIVVVDYNWCIGCRYCEAACPYWARRFNFSTPVIPKEEINPDMAYLGNRIRPRGTMEKCTFCLHRVRQGLNPQCVEACPTGARQFGNMLDPNSTIRHILNEKRVYVFKEEAGTIPRFYYWFDA
ncbi:MAG: 4Fe-4S dicluster domain-containing protein [Candidatus Omnitrophota bacterium]|jgi:molybdopterin-containing oxidoreductase family iron-sulfur binding subunit|nr:MAG: 4Fe-4S dicluster domain-containing protein [Candidatus Omnitrophota bacterium]